MTDLSIKYHCENNDFFDPLKNEYIKSLTYENYQIPSHTHAFYELNIVLNGEGVHYIGNTPCKAFKGRVFMIPPNVRHAYKNENNLVVYHLLIHPNFIKTYLSEFQKTTGFFLIFEIEPYLRPQHRENMFLFLSEEKLKVLNADIKTLEECETITEKNIFINTIAKKMLCDLFISITKNQGFEFENFSDAQTLGNIAEILNYIHQNFNENLSVEHLAKISNVSRSTFIRQFKKICGCSPHKYLIDYRIKKAKEYLTDENKSFTAIAQECGFFDASHLRRYIKKEKFH